MGTRRDREVLRSKSQGLVIPKRRQLSPRELQIARLLAAGKSNQLIAHSLGISVKTVETHRSRIMLKLKLDSLVSLVHYAIRHGIIHV